MLTELPDEVKQRVWRHLAAQELCRVECVARNVSHGANVDAVWKTRTRSLLSVEQSRLAQLRPPVECGLRRQNAHRDVTVALLSATTSGSADRAISADPDDDCALLPAHSAFWRLWYRDCFVSVRAFEATAAAFDGAKQELLELRRERVELLGLLQSVKSANQSEKHARRVHMSCVRWMNRSHRRQSASESLMSAQSAALSKAGLSAELKLVEAALHARSSAVFSLRSQYQKRLHRMTTQLASATTMLRDLGITWTV